MLRMALVTVIAVAVHFVVPLPALAEERFSLEEVFLLALEKNEKIQIAREDVKTAEAFKKEALSSILPKAFVNGSYSRMPEETISFGSSGSLTVLQPKEAYELMGIVEQPVYSGGKSWRGLSIARKQIESAEKGLDLSREDLLIRVAVSFYDVLKAKKNLEALERNVSRLEEHRRLSELRYRVGEVTEAIFLRAAAELAGAVADALTGENDFKVKRRELLIMVGLPEGYELKEPEVPAIPADSIPELMSLAGENRIDLQIRGVQERIGEEQVKFARGGYMPTVSLEGRYFKRGQDPERTFSVDESWEALAMISIPIFQGGLIRSQVAQAKNNLNRERYQTVTVRKQVEMDVTRASLNFEAVTRVLESREDQLRFAKENFEMVSRQFTFGVVTNIDMLDANQLLIEAERDVIQASLNRHIAILDLQRSAGVLLDMTLGKEKTSL
ncbi:MAG TPA: TolC family protein [Nitrospiria bacterium]|nr:TolC family protein [Nitrospiria bacterium]